MSQHDATPHAERSELSVRHNVREVTRVSEQMDDQRAASDFGRYFDDETSPSEGSLRDIVVLAVSHGVSFESDTLAFLLDLSQRLIADAYEPAIVSLYAGANSLASQRRHYGLHYLDDADTELVVSLLSTTNDDGAVSVSRRAWLTVIAAIGSASDASPEERAFMLEELATYLIETSDVMIAADARPFVIAARDAK